MTKARKDNPRAMTAGDTIIGKQIRARRLIAGMSQAELGEALSVSFQQVQKYEKGANHVGVIRLTQIAKALNCNPTDLMPEQTTRHNGAATELMTLMATADGVKLAKAFHVLPASLRKSVVTIVEQMGAAR